MARPMLTTLVTDITNITQVTSTEANLIKRALQESLDFICAEYDWWWLNTRGFITTVAPYTTGTVAITNGLKALVGTGTTFTKAMEDRKIRIAGSNTFYTLDTYTDATHFTIKEPFDNDTVTAATFSIFKNEFRLASDVDSYKMLRWMDTGYPILDINANLFDIVFPDQDNEGDPLVSAPIGTRPDDTYEVGTVSITVNTSTLTGTSTVWTTVEGLGRGTQILLANSELVTVKKVSSNTSITIYEKAASEHSGVAYKVILDNPVIILHDIPDSAKNIYYRYQRIPNPFVNDTDVPDIPRNWIWVLKEFAIRTPWRFKGDENKSNTSIQWASAILNRMKARAGYISGARVYAKKSVDNARRSNTGRLPAQYDIKYSA